MNNENGSQINGGCPAMCHSVNLCQCSDNRNKSGLHIDGIIPDINTSETGTWANQLFSICSQDTTLFIGFEFHEPIQITSVELDLFICYQWSMPRGQVNVTISTSQFLMLDIDEEILGYLAIPMSQGNCNSLIRIVISFNNNSTSKYYLVRFSSQTTLNRLYIGEMIFGNKALNNSSKLL